MSIGVPAPHSPSYQTHIDPVFNSLYIESSHNTAYDPSQISLVEKEMVSGFESLSKTTIFSVALSLQPFGSVYE